jgi:hypothetical protein
MSAQAQGQALSLSLHHNTSNQNPNNPVRPYDYNYIKYDYMTYQDRSQIQEPLLFWEFLRLKKDDSGSGPFNLFELAAAPFPPEDEKSQVMWQLLLGVQTRAVQDLYLDKLREGPDLVAQAMPADLKIATLTSEEWPLVWHSLQLVTSNWQFDR